MGPTLKMITRLLVLLGSLILFYFLVVFVASVVQLAEFADRLHLGLGQVVFVILIFILVAVVISPLYIYFKFPKAILPPIEDSGLDYEKYMQQLRLNLRSNSLVINQRLTLETDVDVRYVLDHLSKEADNVIREAAGAIFLGTALSQNGKLDGLITLTTQIRMVWKIACIYQQRPSPRQLLYLYSQVAINVLLAESIDDYDFSIILTPIIASALATGSTDAIGSLVSEVVDLAHDVPGKVLVSNVVKGISKSAEGAVKLITNSVIDGTANAFLTLRVGCITNQYCSSISKPDKSIVRRNATYAAASMITDIAKNNSVQIFAAAKKVAKEKSKSIPRKVTDSVEDAYRGVKNVSAKSTNSAVNAAKSIGNSVSSVFKKSL